MSHVCDRYLPRGQGWRELFELVLVGARKPSFFEGRSPAFEVVSDDGLLRPHVGKLRSGGCYFGGNAADVEAHLGLRGEEILYVGDHVFSDVEISKNVLRWRTALVLRELEEEIAALEQVKQPDVELSQLMRDKETAEQEHCRLRLELQRRRQGYGPRREGPEAPIHERLRVLREAMTELDTRIGPLAERTSRALNDRWGPLLRAGNDKSMLAQLVERYADVYTSRVSNLLYTTPFAYLRSPRSSLPHDPTSG
jgi:hypothetical protein